MKQRIGTYQLHGVDNESQAKIIPVGFVDLSKGERINDTVIRPFEIKKNIMGVICGCNITDSYLVSTKKLPMFTVNIIYELVGKTTLLGKLYFLFTITQPVTSQEEFINNPLNGRYSLEFGVDQTNKVVIDHDFGVYPGLKEIIFKLEDIVKSSYMTELFDDIVNEENKKIKGEHDYMYDGSVPKPTINLSNYLE